MSRQLTAVVRSYPSHTLSWQGIEQLEPRLLLQAAVYEPIAPEPTWTHQAGSAMYHADQRGMVMTGIDQSGMQQVQLSWEGDYRVKPVFNAKTNPALFDPATSTVSWQQMVEGVNWHAGGTAGGVKYAFELSPGVDSDRIRMQVSGADSLSIDSSGRLLMDTDFGRFVDDVPVAWQYDASFNRTDVQVRYSLEQSDIFGFEVISEYDPSLPLWIDPDIHWQQNIAGDARDQANAVYVDANGRTYVTGTTWATGSDTGYAAYVNCYDGQGQMQWTRQIGRQSTGADITGDQAGNLYLTGRTAAAGWASGGADPVFNGATDAMVVKLAADDGRLLWSSYLGGGQEDGGEGIAVDGQGRIWVTGYTASGYWMDQPIGAGFGGSYDAFVVQLDTLGRQRWGRYLGSGSVDVGYGIAADLQGGAYVVGYAASGDWYDHAQSSGFIAGLDGDGGVRWAEGMGGSTRDIASDVAVDAQGNAWIGGVIYDPETADHSAAVVHFAKGGTREQTSLLGGSGYDRVNDIALDANGCIWVVGRTSDGQWMIGDDLADDVGFVAQMDNVGQMLWATRIPAPGEASADGRGIGVGPGDGDVLAVGNRAGGDGPFLVNLVDRNPSIRMLLGEQVLTDASPISFGTIGQGGPGIEQRLSIQHHGMTPVQLSVASLSSGFALVQPPATVLGAGQQTSLKIQMTSSQAGEHHGLLQLRINGTLRQIPLSGRVVAEPEPVLSAVTIVGANPGQNTVTVRLSVTMDGLWPDELVRSLRLNDGSGALVFAGQVRIAPGHSVQTQLIEVEADPAMMLTAVLADAQGQWPGPDQWIAAEADPSWAGGSTGSGADDGRQTSPGTADSNPGTSTGAGPSSTDPSSSSPSAGGSGSTHSGTTPGGSAETGTDDTLPGDQTSADSSTALRIDLSITLQDMDQNGYADMVWRDTSTGRVYVDLMQAGQVIETIYIGRCVDAQWQIVGIGDWNHDRHGDLLWHHRTRGEVSAWLINDRRFQSHQFVSQVKDIQWELAGVHDMDHNQVSDLVWFHRRQGTVSSWQLDRSLKVVRRQTLPGVDEGQHALMGLGDINGDGVMDMLWRDRRNGQVTGWLMQPDMLQVDAQRWLGQVDGGWSVGGSGRVGMGGLPAMLLYNGSRSGRLWILDWQGQWQQETTLALL